MLKALFCSTCIFLFTAPSANSFNSPDYFSKAVRIFGEGRYFEASIEFERAIFYESDSNRVVQYKYYKSLCYKELALYNKALEELKGINLENVHDTLFMLIRYEQAVCAYLNNDINQALSYINEFRTRVNGPFESSDIILLNILCLNANRNWGNALVLWNKYIDNCPVQDPLKDIFKTEIAALYDRKNIPKYYSPGKAGNLSRFIPGSGQIYCGSIPDGTLNFLINMSLLGYSIWEIYSGYFFTGNYSILVFFNRFYIGGINRAQNIAMEKNDKGVKRFNAENSSLMAKIISTKYLKE
jgi:tetratricopeptide (TPR) repeat protein